MMDARLWVHVEDALVHMELASIGEFCDYADQHFHELIDNFKDQFNPDQVLSEEEQGFVFDRLQELKGHTHRSAYYGVLTVFSVWERYLYGMYKYTRALSLRPELQNIKFSVDKSWLKLNEYRTYFKELGVQMPTPPFNWEAIEELRDYRNAIAHQGGTVTGQNIKALQSHQKPSAKKYKLGDRLEIRVGYVSDSIELITKTSREFGTQYLETLKELGIAMK